MNYNIHGELDKLFKEWFQWLKNFDKANRKLIEEAFEEWEKEYEKQNSKM